MGDGGEEEAEKELIKSLLGASFKSVSRLLHGYPAVKH